MCLVKNVEKIINECIYVYKRRIDTIFLGGGGGIFWMNGFESLRRVQRV